MNALHYRGSTSERVTVLREVVTVKMKGILKPWLTGSRAAHLSQVHLHIDDPSLVLKHKSPEQQRRDETRQEGTGQNDSFEVPGQPFNLGFAEELKVPWSTLLNDRNYMDELATLHLFCRVIAAFELLTEKKKQGTVFLHGGKFAIDTSFTKSTPGEFVALHSSELDHLDDTLKGFVILKRKQRASIHEKDTDTFRIPRTRSIVFKSDGTACISEYVTMHGESETRFVSAFKNCVLSFYQKFMSELQLQAQRISRQSSRSDNFRAWVILSDDTDVFIILLCNAVLHRMGV